MEYGNDNKADKNNATGKGTEIKLGNILMQFIQYIPIEIHHSLYNNYTFMNYSITMYILKLWNKQEYFKTRAVYQSVK